MSLTDAAGSLEGGSGVPAAVLAALPSDPSEQLGLAARIAASAAAALERENSRLRRDAAELRDRVVLLDGMLRDSETRLRTALEDNIKLAKERDAMAEASKKMARDVQKLETFKRQLIRSLRDDNSPQEAVDITTCDQPSTKFTPSEDGGSMGRSVSNVVGVSAELANAATDASRPPVPKFSITPHYTPRLTPTATPKVTSTAGSPRNLSTGSPLVSGSSSPTKHQFDGRMAMTPWYHSSKQSSAANSPPRGRANSARPPRIDGKEFFRLARSRLSYEQFGAFLANIKELNAHKQTREDTLKKANEIFGPENKDLYLSFQGLLSRSMS